MGRRPSILAILAILGALLACRPRADTRVTVADDETPRTEQSTTPADHGTSPLALSFGWTPGRLQVIEKVNKKDRDAVMNYTLEVREVSGGLAVEYQDFHFTALEGFDFEDPAVRAEIADIERNVAMMQLGFDIGPDGAFIGLLDTESLVHGIHGLGGPEAAATVRKMLENPQWRRLLEDASAKPWRAWVEVWIGLEAEPGDILEGEVEADFGGAPLLQHIRYEHLGPDPLRPGNIRLRYDVHVDDPRFMAGLGDLAVGLVDEPDPDKVEAARAAANEAAEELDFSYVRVIEVSMVPQGMMPAWVKDVLHVNVRHRDPGAPDENRERSETHEWTFKPIR